MAGKPKFRDIGLARALSKLGYCSRSRAAQLIRAGRVALNGRQRLDPESPVHLERDRITVDSVPIAAPGKIYLMLNKPRGVVTTASDQQARQTVYDLLDADLPWVAPVGRLDKASEGLLLLTNDSEWGARVQAPETHVEKTYHVQVRSIPPPKLIASLAHGVTSDGDFLRVRSVRVLRGGKRNTWLEIVLDEGKNRHIRRMLAEHDIEVLRLVRVAIGPLTLGELAKGRSRRITPEEKEALDKAMETRKRQL